MAVVPVVPVFLIAIITKCHSESTNGYSHNSGNNAEQYGGILKPPPPPPLPILPVPFHGGNTGRLRQIHDNGYLYQPPPPPAPSFPLSSSGDFKFPAPFYKQYNFNFVPPPQPFTTTPSPSIFQKVSGWLFPSQQVSYDTSSDISQSVPPLKSDCNPCNLVPWIPVIRYDLTSNKARQHLNPTYGPPSPTTSTTFNTAQNVAKPFSHHNIYAPNQISYGSTHAVYGPPVPQANNEHIRFQSSTYGPPSPTHSVTISNQTPINSQFSTNSIYERPSSSDTPLPTYGLPSSSYTAHSSNYNFAASYSTPVHSQFSSTTHYPVSTNYDPKIANNNYPTRNDINEPSLDLQLPKITYPTGFRNSYGEPIINTYALDVPYSVSAPAASTKYKTQVLPDNNENVIRPNMTVALANPAPFSLNRGRNIHTLQPVALPNLSVSPLPPIFNARPFRSYQSNYPNNVAQGINNLQANNVNVAKSIPLVEYTHSVDYPTTFIQSPVIDIDELKNVNQSKAYRNIPNSYEIDEIPQASELSSAKLHQDASLESINFGLSNDLFDGLPLDLKQPPNIPSNHKVSFADLRGVKDEDVDKYRTESNLQHIDSPLLYLKPSAPHKNFKNFFYTTTPPGKPSDYEMYDDYVPTTSSSASTVSELEEKSVKLTDSTQKVAEEENRSRPKIVQIIVPYTTGQRVDTGKNSYTYDQRDLTNNIEQQYQARKIQAHTEKNYYTLATESISSIVTTTEDPMTTVTEPFEMERFNTPAILSDLYDVKEAPFDIIKLQHTIDDWTEQEYSKQYQIPQRSRSNEKHAKQIPDEYLTTPSQVTSYTTENSYNYDLYDHEGSSSIQHTVIENRTNDIPMNRKEYNTIQKNNTEPHIERKNQESNKNLHIYTAASTFRATTTTTTTTSAPWGKIQTSISPLTNEKVYVVTSKPWREKNGKNEYDYEGNDYNSKKTELYDSVELEMFPFKSPRFSNRPSYGFTADAVETVKLDSPYGFSKGWHRRINNLENSSVLSNEHTYYDEDKKSQRTTKQLEGDNK